MNEAEIREHFIESAKGDPCHLCGSKRGMRVLFMDLPTHPSCIQSMMNNIPKDYNNHGWLRS